MKSKNKNIENNEEQLLKLEENNFENYHILYQNKQSLNEEKKEKDIKRIKLYEKFEENVRKMENDKK